FNFPAFLMVLILTLVLVRGIRESAGTNNIMVLLKITAILVFIVAGSHFIHPGHWHPFFPNGWSGVLTGLIPWQALVHDAAPVVNTLKKLSHDNGSATLNWVRLIVLCGAMMGMISSILVFQ